MFYKECVRYVCLKLQKEIEVAAEGNNGDRNWHPSHYGNRKKKKPSPSSSSKVSSIIKKCPRCDYSTPKGFNMRVHIMSMHLGKKARHVQMYYTSEHSNHLSQIFIHVALHLH